MRGARCRSASGSVSRFSFVVCKPRSLRCGVVVLQPRLASMDAFGGAAADAAPRSTCVSAMLRVQAASACAPEPCGAALRARRRRRALTAPPSRFLARRQPFPFGSAGLRRDAEATERASAPTRSQPTRESLRSSSLSAPRTRKRRVRLWRSHGAEAEWSARVTRPPTRRVGRRAGVRPAAATPTSATARAPCRLRLRPRERSASPPVVARAPLRAWRWCGTQRSSPATSSRCSARPQSPALTPQCGVGGTSAP